VILWKTIKNEQGTYEWKLDTSTQDRVIPMSSIFKIQNTSDSSEEDTFFDPSRKNERSNTKYHGPTNFPESYSQIENLLKTRRTSQEEKEYFIMNAVEACIPAVNLLIGRSPKNRTYKPILTYLKNIVNEKDYRILSESKYVRNQIAHNSINREDIDFVVKNIDVFTRLLNNLLGVVNSNIYDILF
jgi:uncharacterized protein YutE (UPF0331/DUF86 family)